MEEWRRGLNSVIRVVGRALTLELHCVMSIAYVTYNVWQREDSLMIKLLLMRPGNFLSITILQGKSCYHSRYPTIIVLQSQREGTKKIGNQCQRYEPPRQFKSLMHVHASVCQSGGSTYARLIYGLSVPLQLLEHNRMGMMHPRLQPLTMLPVSRQYQNCVLCS